MTCVLRLTVWSAVRVACPLRGVRRWRDTSWSVPGVLAHALSTSPCIVSGSAVASRVNHFPGAAGVPGTLARALGIGRVDQPDDGPNPCVFSLPFTALTGARCVCVWALRAAASHSLSLCRDDGSGKNQHEHRHASLSDHRSVDCRCLPAAASHMTAGGLGAAVRRTRRATCRAAIRLVDDAHGSATEGRRQACC